MPQLQQVRHIITETRLNQSKPCDHFAAIKQVEMYSNNRTTYYIYNALMQFCINHIINKYVVFMLLRRKKIACEHGRIKEKCRKCISKIVCCDTWVRRRFCSVFSSDKTKESCFVFFFVTVVLFGSRNWDFFICSVSKQRKLHIRFKKNKKNITD